MESCHSVGNFLQVDNPQRHLQVHSAPSSRTNSLKLTKQQRGALEIARKSLPEQFLPCFKTSSSSSTSHLSSADMAQCVKCFRITSRGTQNLGNAFRCSDGSLTGTSNAALMDLLLLQSKRNRGRGRSDSSEGSNGSYVSSGYFRVPVLGLSGVGKQTLLRNLTKSLCQDDSGNSVGPEASGSVQVMLDGEESTIEFLSDRQFQNEESGALNVDAYVIVFAVDNRKSFLYAVDTIASLREVWDTDRPIILVANKIDIVRKRKIKFSEAKEIAEVYRCKYIETSVILQHNIDDLLVCILRQIHLKLDPELLLRGRDVPKKNKQRKSLKGAKSAITRFFNINGKAHYSCEDLFNM